MTTITISEVLGKIRRDLDWRGPNDKHLGHVCMPYDHAEYLHQWAIKLTEAKDAIESKSERVHAENEQLKSLLQTSMNDIIKAVEKHVNKTSEEVYPEASSQ